MPRGFTSPCIHATSAGWARRIATSLARCVEQDLVLVTANARDFRALVATRDVHPGLVILPSVGRERSESLLRDAIAFLSERGDPMDVMVNHVLELSTEAAMTLSMLPAQEK